MHRTHRQVAASNEVSLACTRLGREGDTEQCRKILEVSALAVLPDARPKTGPGFGGRCKTTRTPIAIEQDGGICS